MLPVSSPPCCNRSQMKAAPLPASQNVATNQRMNGWTLKQMQEPSSVVWRLCFHSHDNHINQTGGKAGGRAEEVQWGGRADGAGGPMGREGWERN